MPSSVTIFSVTKFRPGQQTMTLASVIFIASGTKILTAERADGTQRAQRKSQNRKRTEGFAMFSKKTFSVRSVRAQSQNPHPVAKDATRAGQPLLSSVRVAGDFCAAVSHQKI